MKRMLALVGVTLLVGCNPATPTDSVESLMANPERLKDLRQRCRLDRDKVGSELCSQAAEAANRKFFGDGKKTPYTPPKESPKI